MSLVSVDFVISNIAGEDLSLLPEKAIYWKAQKALLIADLHLGKVSHFRKNGIAIPQAASKSNEDRWLLLLDSLEVEKVILLGDLFHSDFNDEWGLLEQVTNAYPEIEFHLIVGNHDILDLDRYKATRLIIHPETWEVGPFLFSHEPLEDIPADLYNLCGHIHPGIILRGRGKQRLRLPCFFFGPESGILPAFGAFTGLFVLSKQIGNKVYAIANQQVIEV